jgi:hypothetical protein
MHAVSRRRLPSSARPGDASYERDSVPQRKSACERRWLWAQVFRPRGREQGGRSVPRERPPIDDDELEGNPDVEVL